MTRPSPPARRADRRFFSTDASTLARRLLGCTLVRILDSGTRVSGRIVEGEAYIGIEDAASHAFGGRRTPRNESMYACAGTAYVYFTYGMHHCFNVVCGKAGEPAAVLIRALEPIDGVEHVRQNRLRHARTRSKVCIADTRLLAGPARLCQGFEIDRQLDGADLVESPRLYIERASRAAPASRIAAVPRIGIGDRGDWTPAPLRYLLIDSKHLSTRAGIPTQ